MVWSLLSLGRAASAALFALPEKTALAGLLAPCSLERGIGRPGEGCGDALSLLIAPAVR
jgi:hypothetical protein